MSAERSPNEKSFHRRARKNAEPPSASDLDQVAISATRVCGQVRARLRLERDVEAPAFENVISAAHHEFRSLVRRPYRADPVDDLLLARFCVTALRTALRPAIAEACKRTPPERQEDLLRTLREQLDPPMDAAEDPHGAFLDPRSLDLDRLGRMDPHERFVVLELVHVHACTLVAGFEAAGLSLLAAATVAVRGRGQANARKPARKSPAGRRVEPVARPTPNDVEDEGGQAGRRPDNDRRAGRDAFAARDHHRADARRREG